MAARSGRPLGRRPGHVPFAVRVALVGATLLLLISGLDLSAAAPAAPTRPSATAVGARGSDSESAAARFVGWDPASGGASPGAPHFALVTRPIRSASPAGRYAGTPVWLAYDSADNAFWVAAEPSSVDVSSATCGYGAVLPVGRQPFAVAVDDATDTVFVSNVGSDNVTVINATACASSGSYAVGREPHGMAFDPANGLLYVADSGSNAVSVVSEARGTVVATVPVGRDPIGVAYDPVHDRIYVADHDSYAVTVLSGRTNRVIATLPAGVGPYGVALDNTTNTVFVTNEGSDNLTVLNASSDRVEPSIFLGLPVIRLYGYTEVPEGLAYDNGSQLLWIGTGAWFMVLVNATTRQVSAFVDDDPAGMAWDPVAGVMCATNTNNVTYACLSDFSYPQYASYPATLVVTEKGLPKGTPWNLTLEGIGTVETSTNTTEQLPVGWMPSVGVAAYNITIPPASGYVATPSLIVRYPWYANFSQGITVTFHPATFYAVRFAERGLPPDTGWNVLVDGVRYATTRHALTIFAPNGTYPVVVAAAGSFRTTLASASVTVNGTAASDRVAFEAEGRLRIVQSGLSTAHPPIWYVNLTNASGAHLHFTVVGASFQTLLPIGNYTLTIQSAGYVATPGALPVMLHRAGQFVRVRFS